MIKKMRWNDDLVVRNVHWFNYEWLKRYWMYRNKIKDDYENNNKYIEWLKKLSIN